MYILGWNIFGCHSKEVNEDLIFIYTLAGSLPRIFISNFSFSSSEAGRVITWSWRCIIVFELICCLVLILFQNPHLSLSGTTFTVGQGPQCDLCINDESVSSKLCRFKHIEVSSIYSARTLLIYSIMTHYITDLFCFVQIILDSAKGHLLHYWKSLGEKVKCK